MAASITSKKVRVLEGHLPLLEASDTSAAVSGGGLDHVEEGEGLGGSAAVAGGLGHLGGGQFFLDCLTIRVPRSPGRALCQA